MTIGQRIKELRLERKWPRRTVALMTGFSEQTIINWEKGTYKPSKRGIRALEKAFRQQLPHDT
jgi:DNA-binding XRE family transcriptional regulator